MPGQSLYCTNLNSHLPMVRNRRRRKVLKAIGSGSVALIAGCTGDNPNGKDTETTRVVGGWSSEGTSGFAVGQVIAKILDQNSDSVRMDSRSTGAGQNLRLLSKGNIDLGYTQSYSYANAMREVAPWNDPPIETKPWQGFGVTPGALFFVSRSESNIKTISDFAGKPVTITNPDIGAYSPTREVLKSVGVWDQIDERSMALSEVPNAFVNGRIDATLVLSLGLDGDLVAGAFQEMLERSNSEDITVVEPTDSEVEDMLIPGLKKRDAVPNLPNIDKEAPEISMPVMWYNVYTRPELEDDALYEIVKMMYENKDEMADGHPFGRNMDERKFIGGMNPEHPVHPGAAKFYKEQGWWDDELSEGSR